MKGTWPLMAPAQLMGVWIKKSVIKERSIPDLMGGHGLVLRAALQMRAGADIFSSQEAG